jgi:hypothetical protein
VSATQAPSPPDSGAAPPATSTGRVARGGGVFGRLRRDAPSLLAQLVLTAVGVYLGLRADQWREDRTTAWDLAMATQALSLLDQTLAFELSDVYTRQQAVARFTDQYLASLFNTNILAQQDVAPGVLAMENYFRETARDEQLLLAQYDSLVPRIDAALRH